MVALQGLAAASGSDFKITITPEVTSIKLPSAGSSIDITATATELELGGAGLPPIEIAANITPENQAIITSLLDPPRRAAPRGSVLSLARKHTVRAARADGRVSYHVFRLGRHSKEQPGHGADHLAADYHGCGRVGGRYTC